MTRNADKISATALEKLSPTLVPELKTYFDRHRGELARMLEGAETSGMSLARRHAKIMDGVLTSLYPAAYAMVRRRWRSPTVSISAVGGYGRGLVGLHSDIDVRIVTSEAPEKVRAMAEALLYPLWDAGVTIGHQVVSVGDAVAGARTDLPTATVLLDWRHVAGEPTLAAAIRDKAHAGVFGDSELGAFVKRLDEEVAERHGRFGGSVYLLEPDVKSGAGGLRDLDVALWAARARWRVADFEDLVRLGVIVPRQLHEIVAAREFLWAVRNHLHAAAKRRSDRLSFDDQARVARALGFGGVDAPEEGSSVDAEGAMVERFMSDYYRHARAVTRVREQILARATPHVGRRRPHEEDLGGGLRAFEGQVTFADASQLSSTPALAFRLYAAALARQATILPFARDCVLRATHTPGFAEALRESEEGARLFVDLVCTVKDAGWRGGSILRELHDVGLLTAMVPEFAPVVGRVHHDVYHVYTVDVHSVAAVDKLRALARGELSAEYDLASRLAAEITRPHVLFLATLLHDVGKAIGGKDHSTRGAEMAKPILARLRMPQDDVDEICHLIGEHLLMYHVATRRDLDDGTTLADFAAHLHGHTGLRELYLLTVADLSTTSPTAMTGWKARMLDDLFLATDALLSGQSVSAEKRVERVRDRVREQWGGLPERAFLESFIATMPDRYLVGHGADEIVAHAKVALSARSGTARVEIVPSRHPEAAELCVVAQDRPGLLAAITAAIAASRLEVHRAEIHSRTLDDGSVEAVDLFSVRDRVDGESGVARTLPKLERDLRALLAGEVAEQDLLAARGGSAWRERPSPPVSTEVRIDDRVARHTVVEMLTRDRPGLLHALAHAVHELGLSIALAKINTEGTRVVDVFYVSEADGSKIAPGARAQAVKDHLRAAVEALARGGSS